MSTVQEVAFAFDNSAKKLHAFLDEREADTATKENMKKGNSSCVLTKFSQCKKL
jgi:hypothetical protein